MEELSFEDFPNFTGKGEAPCVQYPADIFFPDYEGPNHTQLLNAARRVCINCPYQLECLTYGVENSMEGVWGGTSELERRNMRAQGEIVIPNPDRRGVRIYKRKQPTK